MTDNDTMEVLYNACYGGFGFSPAALELYQTYNPTKFKMEPDRTDPIMIRVVKELGDRANSTFSSIKITKIPKKFQNHFEISEYDGSECVVINHRKYQIDRVREILNLNSAAKEKLKMIHDLIKDCEQYDSDS